MSHQSPTALLRELKGAPLSVLIALLINRQTTGEKWIIAATGYSQNKVREALTHLSEIHLVTRAGRYNAWQLTQEGYQLPLGLDLVTPGLPGQLDPDTMGESQNLTLPAVTSSSSSSIVERQKSKVEEEDESQKMTLASNLQALHAIGIMGKTADSLARMPHINPGFIHAHHKKWSTQSYQIGTLVVRLRDGDPIDQSKSHTFNPYLSGEFAQYINH
jgi:hypothetical protein